jgi:hypothetical protein
MAPMTTPRSPFNTSTSVKPGMLPAARRGENVRFRDGSGFGFVRELAERSFQVETGDLLFWVSNEAIMRRDGDVLVLLCDASDLGLYAPRGVPVSGPLLEPSNQRPVPGGG